MNHLAIVLQELGADRPQLDLNDAVTVHFPCRPKSPVPQGEVLVGSKIVTQHGKRWLPLDDNLNVVSLGQCLFYVKAIIFGESKWRRPAPPNRREVSLSPKEKTVQSQHDEPAVDRE